MIAVIDHGARGAHPVVTELRGVLRGLADELATGQPQPIMQRCEAKANQYRQALEDWDVEDASTSFAPDQRALYSSWDFR